MVCLVLFPEYIPVGPRIDYHRVSHKSLMPYTLKITSSVKGLYGMVKYGLEIRNGIFGITFLNISYMFIQEIILKLFITSYTYFILH